MSAIEPTQKVTGAVVPASQSVGSISGEGVSFKNIFTELLNQTNQNLSSADQTVKDFVQGKIDNPHDVMIKLEEAQLGLQFTVQMRNKVVEAYQELMRMQL